MKRDISIMIMCGYLIVLALPCIFVFSTTVFTPNSIAKQHIRSVCISQEQAISQAIKDVEKARIYIILHGMPDYDEKEYIEMKELEKKYGFKYIGWGCIGGGHNVSLYEQVMKRNINEKAQQFVFRTFDKYTLERFKDKIK
jgi:hypothetical protein